VSSSEATYRWARLSAAHPLRFSSLSPSIFQRGVLAEDATNQCAVVKTPNCKIWLIQANFFLVWRMKNHGVVSIAPVVTPSSGCQPRLRPDCETPRNAPTPDSDKCRSCTRTNPYFPVSKEMKQDHASHLHHNEFVYKTTNDPNCQSRCGFMPMQTDIVWQVYSKQNRWRQ